MELVAIDKDTKMFSGSPTKKPRTNDKRIYFQDVVKYDTQWKRLSVPLESARPNRGWRALGEILLQKTANELDLIGKEKNPARVLLEEWKDTEEAYMDELIKALNTIGNNTVCRVLESILTGSKEPAPTTKKTPRQSRSSKKNSKAQVNSKPNQGTPVEPEQRQTEQPLLISPMDLHSQAMVSEVAPAAEANINTNAGMSINSESQPMDIEKPKESSGATSPNTKQTNKQEYGMGREALWKCTRLVVVGDSGAGKTSFIRWLRGKDFDPKLSSTVGIDICTVDTQSWKSVFFNINDFAHQDVPSSKRVEDFLTTDVKKAIYIWDFAGQENNTHHLFFNNAAIYVVVVDITLPIEHNKARIKFWVESIQYYTKTERDPNDNSQEGGKSSPIFLVGTHKDCLKTDGILEFFASIKKVTDTQQAEADRIMKELLKPYQPIFANAAVSIKLESPENIQQELVTNRIGKHKCKLSWMLLYQELVDTAKKTTFTTLSLDHACKLAAQFNMTQDEVQTALKFYHNLGLTFHLPDRDIILPQQLVDAFKSLFTELGLKGKVGYKNFQTIHDTGRITEALLKTIWSEFSEEFRTQLKIILQNFGLIFRDPLGHYVIPSLVGREVDKKTIQEFANGETSYTLRCSISGVPPLAFSTSFIANLETEPGIQNCQLYKDGCIFTTEGKCKFLVSLSPNQTIIQGVNTEYSHALEVTKKLICLVHNSAKLCSKNEIQMAIQVRCIYCQSRSKSGEMVPLPAENICETIHKMEHTAFLCQHCKGLRALNNA